MIVIGIVFIATFFTIPPLVHLLKLWQMGQIIREEGPASHLSKKGTPTMGGIIFVINTLIMTIFYLIVRGINPEVIWGCYMVTAYSLVGFLDDYLKKIKKSPYGLKAREDIGLQILLACPFLLYLALTRQTSLPLWIWIPFKLFLLLAITNSVNLTDGLDGLLSGVTLMVFVFFFWAFPQALSLNPFLIYVLTGSLLAFLYYNFYPASLFMGNLGSFALGGFIAFLVLWTNIDFLFIVLGGIFFLEALSVILQVLYFKYTKKKTGEGKRIFRMAPIHHHFELMKIQEPTITVRFWLLQTILTLISLFIYTNGKGI